jgi:hypothetical protein
MLKPLKKCENRLIYILTCHLQIDAYPVPDPAYHFDADVDADANANADPDFLFNADPSLPILQ